MPEQITQHPGLEKASATGLQLDGDGPILFQVAVFYIPFNLRFDTTQEFPVAQLAWCPGWQVDT